jgi:class 3 adenylate cyclase
MRRPAWLLAIARARKGSCAAAPQSAVTEQRADAATEAARGEVAPAATRGFLFADLRGYTAFVEANGDRAAAELLMRYRDLVRALVAATRGAEVKTEGDSFYVVFETVSAAIRCGLAILEAAGSPAAGPLGPIGVGVGVHAGETLELDGGYVGSAVNIAARLAAQARPGELLVSDTARALTRTSVIARFEALGPRRLKGVSEPITVYRALSVGGGSPAPRAASGRPRVRHRLLAAIAALAVLVGAGGVAGAVALRGAGPPAAPSASAPAQGSTTTLAAAAASSAASGAAPTPTADVYPDGGERRLLAALSTLPGGFADTCRRGPYLPTHGGTKPERDEITQVPIASVECAPPLAIGTSDLLVRQYANELPRDSFVTGYILALAGGPSSTTQIPPGDCATARRAWGRWSAEGRDRGSVVCWTDATTGAAHLDWSDEAPNLIVEAVNPTGDYKALYAFFRRYAEFIAP